MRRAPGRAAVDSSGRIGIVAALAAEARALGRVIPLRSQKDLGVLPGGSLLVVSGMGYEAAARGASRLIEVGCGALASWGFAGGLDPGLAPGTIVVPETLLFDGAPALNAVRDWRERVVGSLSPSAHARARACIAGARSARPRIVPPLPVMGGRLLTSRAPLISVDAKETAFRETLAVAVDMESYAVAEVAAARGIPALAVRVIVDTARDEVPRILAETDARGRIAVGKLIAGTIAAPGTLGPLLRLARHYRAARRSLRAIAYAGVLDGYAA